MKTSFLRILIIICAVVWSIGAQAQKSIDLINDNDRVQLDEARSIRTITSLSMNGSMPTISLATSSA